MTEKNDSKSVDSIDKTTTQTNTKASVVNKGQLRNAAAQASKLLRGIDNEVVAIKKHQKSLDERTSKVAEHASTVGKLIDGISNAIMTISATPASKEGVGVAAKAAKAEKPVKVKAEKPIKVKAEKPAKVKAEKKVKAVKPAKVKAEKKVKAVKPAKVKADKPSKTPANRPSLKTVIDEILKDSPMKASTIYTEACKRHGSWSRQSLYSALKDSSKYSKSGNGVDAMFQISNSITDDEANSLIKRVEDSIVTSSVV